MRFRALYSVRICHLACVLFGAAMLAVPAASVLAQSYGAEQSVRRSVDNLGGSPSDADPRASSANPAAVSYQREVLPILRANCHGCHRPDRPAGGLEMTAVASLLTGGESGTPAVVPGDPDGSYLVQQITPQDGEAAMPPRKRPLAATQIALIRRWIEQGAFDDSSPGATPDAYRGERSLPYGSASTSGMIDTTYVSPTAIAVVVIRPAQIMSAPIAELLPLEVLTAAGQQYLGFDPASIEEIVAFVGQINILKPAETELGAAIKFSSPFRAASINREIRGHAQLNEFAGKRYLQSMHPVMPSFYGPDNRTLVVTRDATLRRLIESKDQPKSGPIVDRVRSIPSGSDLYVAIDMASLRPFMEMGLAQAKTSGQVPPQAEKFLEIPKLIAAAELTLNLTGAGPMSLVVHANDEAAAEQLETLVAEASNAPGTSAVGRYSVESPVAQAVNQYIERFSRPFRPQRNGTSVTLFHVDAQSAAQQQLASLAVFGIGVGIQSAQAAAAAAERAAATTGSPDGSEGGGIVDPAQPAEAPLPAEYPRRR